MTDKPILFSAPMVQALLACRKTQTRRLLKPQPYTNGIRYSDLLGDILCHNDYLPPATLLMDKGKGGNRYTISDAEDGFEAFGKYRIGDRVWVREAWRTELRFNDRSPKEVPPGEGVTYEADAGNPLEGRLRPSMFMPRWASRLTLLVTDVRVQRLQDISEDDAVAEGIDFDSDYANLCVNIEGAGYANDLPKGSAAIAIYRRLWETINGPGAWAKNPYVAAYTFRPLFKNIDAIGESDV